MPTLALADLGKHVFPVTDPQWFEEVTDENLDTRVVFAHPLDDEFDDVFDREPKLAPLPATWPRPPVLALLREEPTEQERDRTPPEERLAPFPELTEREQIWTAPEQNPSPPLPELTEQERVWTPPEPNPSPPLPELTEQERVWTPPPLQRPAAPPTLPELGEEEEDWEEINPDEELVLDEPSSEGSEPESRGEEASAAVQAQEPPSTPIALFGPASLAPALQLDAITEALPETVASTEVLSASDLEELTRDNGKEEHGYHLTDLVAGLLEDPLRAPAPRPAQLPPEDPRAAKLISAETVLLENVEPPPAPPRSFHGGSFEDQPTQVIHLSAAPEDLWPDPSGYSQDLRPSSPPEKPFDLQGLIPAGASGSGPAPVLPPEMQNADTMVLGLPAGALLPGVRPDPGRRGAPGHTGQQLAAWEGSRLLTPPSGSRPGNTGQLVASSASTGERSHSDPWGVGRSPSGLSLLSAADDPLIGTLVHDQYRVLRRIGVGGMGAVYLADQLDMGRQVALKVVAAQPGDQGEQERRFRREAQAASKLNHPNIVTLHNFGRLNNGTLFLAMEYIEGVPLAQVLKQEGAMNVVRTLDIAIQVCEALAEAHSKGVVHRDLKPDNILLSDRRGVETAKILDFGIAKIVDPNESPSDVTRAGLVRGTPIYMSPEQARGDFIDHRSDIYSVGVILYYMLTGMLPIRADTPFGYLHAHQHQKPQPLRQARPELDLPMLLESLVMRCLMKQPHQRPANVGELETGLRIVRAELMGVTPDPAWGKVELRTLSAARSRWIWLAAGVGLLLILGLFGLIFQVFRDSEPGTAPPGNNQEVRATSGTAASAPLPHQQQAPPPVDQSPRLTGSSAEHRPEWVGDPPLQIGDERVAVGTSGPTSTVDEAIAWATLAAQDQMAHELVAELKQPGLALTLSGLAGQRRADLQSRFGLEMSKLLASGPDPSTEALYSELRSGQEQVARRLDAALVEIARDMGLPAPDIYWEQYRYVRNGAEGSFFLAWARRVLPPRATHRLVATFTAPIRILGMSAVEPYPIISWGLQDPQGGLIYSVTEGSLAAQAEILPGDLIASVEDQPVASKAELARLLRAAQLQPVGGVIRMAIRRAGQGRFEVQLRLPRSASRSSRNASTSGGSIDE